MYMWNMPVHAPTGIAQNFSQGANAMQQMQANALSNQNQATANQYQAPLLQNQVTAGQIGNQYLPYQDVAGINSQNMMTSLAPQMIMAKMMSGGAQWLKAQNGSLPALQKYGTQFDSNGNAIGTPQISQNIAALASMNPLMMINAMNNGQNALSPSYRVPMMPQPNSSIPSNMPQPIQMMPTQNTAQGSQPGMPSTGISQYQPQVGGQSPAQQVAQIPQANGASMQAPAGPGMTYDRLTHTYIDNNTGSSVQPDTAAMQNRDQKGIAAIQRIVPLLKQIQQLSQFSTMPAEAGLEGQKLLNSTGLSHFMGPEISAQGNQALDMAPEAMINTFGLQTTDKSQEVMTDALAHQRGETPLQYTNRLTATAFQMNDFATQNAERIKSGYKLTPNDATSILNNNLMVNGAPVNDWENYADKNNLPLDQLISTNFPLSEIQAYSTKYKMNPAQIMQMIQQKQGAANAGS